MTKQFRVGAALVAGLVLLLAAGCGKHTPGNIVPNFRPSVKLTAHPQAQDSVYYTVRMQWTAFDPDGQVKYFLCAVDPPASGDTAWTRYARYDTTIFFRSSGPAPGSTTVPYPNTGVTSRDYHVFALKAVDNEGAASPAAFIAFTSETVAPQTTITSPLASHQWYAPTAPSGRIEWLGTDPDKDGPYIAGPPIKYYFKFASQTAIQKALSLGSADPSQQDLQNYFSEGLPEAFSTWDSVPAETTFKAFEGLTPGQIWYFAVSALDKAGAYEPRFNMDSNVLRFKVATEASPPLLTVFNSFFSRTQQSGGIDPTDARVLHLEVPQGQPIPFFWEANPNPSARGTTIAGYRWALDLEDIFDDTQRENENQTYRWSSWSVSEQTATVGPFFATADTIISPAGDTTITKRDTHRFYVEARDNVGSVSLMTIEMTVVPPLFKDIPAAEQKFLVFDDARLNPDRGNGLPYSTFPTEAVLDTLLYAVGGMPYAARPAGTLSQPGVFAGFPYDTLDYHRSASMIFVSGLPLSIMVKYNAVVWYTDLLDAGRTGNKLSGSPESALRFIAKAGELNTLAVYLSQGGNAWLFGSGIAPALANAYVTRFGGTSSAFYPYQSGGQKPDATHILWPGNFMYDYMKLQSQMDHIDVAGAGDILSPLDELVAMTPYLPEYQTPGAPWPPDGWRTGDDGRGPQDDPRVGPASTRNVSRWAGLPMLTMTTEFPDWPSPLPASTKDVPYISVPNYVSETHQEYGKPPVTVPVVDTLYLYRAAKYKLRAARDNPDGKPVWLHYSGAMPGQIDWVSAPIWLFERTQLQLVADRIMARFGFQRRQNPRTWTGPGKVDDRDLPMADKQ